MLVKHLARAGYSRDRFEMLLVTADEAWHIVPSAGGFGMRQPVGVGDVTSGLIQKLLQGATLQEAPEHVTAAVYEIMVTTKAMQEYELQVVAAQDRIAKPQNIISAQQSSEISHFAHNDLWADGYYLSLPLTARLVLPDVQPYVA